MSRFQTVDNARAVAVVDLAHLRVAGAHGVDQRHAGETRHRVDDQPRFLVDHQGLLVLEYDVQRHVARQEVEVWDDGQLDLDGLTLLDGEAGASGNDRVDRDLPVFDQPTCLRARELGQLRRDDAVEAVMLARVELAAWRGHACVSSETPPSRKESQARAKTPSTMAESAMLNAG